MEDAIAYLLFTSGSTGAPKGVMVAHRNVTSFVAYIAVRNLQDVLPALGPLLPMVCGDGDYRCKIGCRKFEPRRPIKSMIKDVVPD